MNWQPKETAPKDGSWFLVIEIDGYSCWSPYEFASWVPASEHSYSGVDGDFHPNTNGYFCGTDTSDEIAFSHWLRLPEPPKQY